MTGTVKFRDAGSDAGVHGAAGTKVMYVLLDGERIVGVIRKRSEWYGNLGRRGVRYWYFDFFRVTEDGKAIYEETTHTMRDGTERTTRGPLYTASTRKEAIEGALGDQ